jgi:type I restriction enzyme S subunit
LNNNWKTYKLGGVCTHSKGKKPSVLSTEISGKINIPYINIKAFEKGIYDEYTDGNKCNLCNDGDLLMVWDGARAGFSGKAKKGAIGSTLMKIEPKDFVEKNYLFYFLQSIYRLINTNPRGVGIPHVEPSLLWNAELIIPDLKTQQAIVAKIETLFADLDKSIAALQTAKEQLKLYKQSVLKWAFEGKLTNENVKDGELPKGWKWVKSGELFSFVTSGSRGWAKYYSTSGAVFVRITNMNFNTLKLDLSDGKIQYVSPPSNSEGNRTKIQEGDFLFSITGYLGMFAIAPKLEDAYVNQHVCLCRPKDNFIKKFVGYWIISQSGGIHYLNLSRKGAVKAGLNLDDLKNFPVPLTSTEEQLKIVSEIETRFAAAEKMELAINESLQQSETLRQSILRQAFEGELK